MKTLLVAGARPNFMKIAPIHREALKHADVNCKIVHTGQHYDFEMSQAFFEDLGIPEPHFFLNAGSGSHAEQTAKIMVAFEDVCERERPDLVVVVGDVNSTLACSIVAKKMLIRVAHVEAGLRSFDLTMPEEINRMVTDSISDFFFVTEESGVNNLLREGKPKERIHLVGHVMIDNLLHQLKQLENGSGSCFATQGIKEEKREYAFLTLHRPANVDEQAKLTEIASALNEIAEATPIFFPVHPRTKKMLELHRVSLSPNIFQLPPLGFKESLYLWKDALLVMTDSGGLQEETTALGVPCITLRDNTERPITIELGTNRLAGTSKAGIIEAYRAALDGREKAYKDRLGAMGDGFGARGNGRWARVPPLWDGRAAERIWEIVLRT